MRRRHYWLVGAVFLGMSAGANANELMDLFHSAQQQDPTYLAALHQRDASIQAHPEALAALLPQVTLTDSYDRDKLHVFPTVDGIDGETVYYNGRSWQASLSQVIFNWGAFTTLAKSNLLVAQAEATFLAAEQSLIYRVADAYFSVLNAQDTLRADVDAQQAYREAQDEAKDKFEQGVVAITDLRNAEAAYDTSTATVIVDQRALDTAKRALEVIVGGAPETAEPDASANADSGEVALGSSPEAAKATLRDDIPLAPPEPASQKQWVGFSDESNPLLLSYRYAAEAAAKDVTIARSQALPSLSLVGSAGRTTQDFTGGTDDLSQMVGLQLTWKVFQGGLVLAQSRAAVATREAAKEQYEGQHRTVNKSTRDAYEGMISGIASVKATHRAVESNRVSLEATQVGLKVGTRTEVDVLNAQQALALAERNYYQARYDYLRSVLALRQSAGRLMEADLAQIDQWLIPRSAASTVPAETVKPEVP